MYSVIKLYKSVFATAVCLCVSGGLIGCVNTDRDHKSQTDTPSSKKQIIELTNRVADWQLAHMEGFEEFVPSFQERSKEPKGWIKGTFFKGLIDWSISTKQEEYINWLKDHAKQQHYELGERKYHADDHVVGQYYLSLSEFFGDELMLAPTQKTLDEILLSPSTVSLEFEPKGDEKGYYKKCLKRWCWADALFMSPPVWTKLSKLTGDVEYFELSNGEYWKIVEYLYDKDAHLFLRDSRFFEKKEKNNEKIYWSRGNGWVFYGLTDIITDMPVDHKDRNRYIQLYKEMASALVTLQRKDGFWPVSLKAGELYPAKESSGTAFFVAGLAWGVNNGLLTDAEYIPSVKNGWRALTQSVNSEGMVGWVQQVGYAPDKVSQNETQFYGTGAFLLAGLQVLSLAESGAL